MSTSQFLVARAFFLFGVQAEGWRTRVNTSSRGRFSVVGSICTLLTKSDSEMTGASFWTGTSAIAGWREALGVAKGCFEPLALLRCCVCVYCNSKAHDQDRAAPDARLTCQAVRVWSLNQPAY